MHVGSKCTLYLFLQQRRLYRIWLEWRRLILFDKNGWASSLVKHSLLMRRWRVVTVQEIFVLGYAWCVSCDALLFEQGRRSWCLRLPSGASSSDYLVRTATLSKSWALSCVELARDLQVLIGRTSATEYDWRFLSLFQASRAFRACYSDNQWGCQIGFTNCSHGFESLVKLP